MPTRTSRVIIEERQFDQSGTEQNQGKNYIIHPAGNPLRIDFLFTRDSVIIADADLPFITASVLAANKTGNSLADAVSSNYDPTVQLADWNTKARQCATVNFSGPQLELPTDDSSGYTDYVVEAWYNNYTIGWITLRVFRDDVPPNPPRILSQGVLPMLCADANVRSLYLSIQRNIWTPTVDQEPVPFNAVGPVGILCSDAQYRELSVILVNGLWVPAVDQAPTSSGTLVVPFQLFCPDGVYRILQPKLIAGVWTLSTDQ